MEDKKNIRLFCLPFAGGSAASFTHWRKYFDNRLEIIPIELAGRGRRITDKMYESIDEAVHDIYNNINNHCKSRYALFGHSMGCILLYELMKKMQKGRVEMPCHSFFSGRHPPHIKKDVESIYTLSDIDFIHRISGLGGIPQELCENADFLRYIIPILKNDYKIISEYHNDEIIVFDNDFTIFSGNEDCEIEYDELLLWRMYTKRECNIHIMQGNHFFINDRVKNVTEIINDTLLQYLYP